MPATHIDGVILEEIQTTNVVQLGPQLATLKAWNELNLISLLESCGIKNPTIATCLQLWCCGRRLCGGRIGSSV
ncbi:MAG: hypothetical protein QNL80_00115 [Akkermansiaceae bacterium]|jgi:hypothetical protein|tara:strand:+ start:11270 stop:11491 length:222 start_codon:yes stop_codon:yes gene_type:complete